MWSEGWLGLRAQDLGQGQIKEVAIEGDGPSHEKLPLFF